MVGQSFLMLLDGGGVLLTQAQMAGDIWPDRIQWRSSGGYSNRGGAVSLLRSLRGFLGHSSRWECLTPDFGLCHPVQHAPIGVSPYPA
jgi:hypothetical protein